MAIENEVFPCPGRQAVIRRVANGSLGASLHAIRAEQAASQVKADASLANGDGVGRTSLGAVATADDALGRVHDGQTAKSFGERWLLAWVGNRAMSLFEPGTDYGQHLQHLQFPTSQSRSTTS